MYGFGGSRFGNGASAGNGEVFDDHPLAQGSSNNRRPALNGRITGSVIEWKGKFGWVQPDTPINHPQAKMKGGKVYLSQEDVTEELSGVGAHVSFYCYADGTGMGAMLCVPSNSATASKPFKPKPKMPAAKPKAKATPGRKRVSEEQLSGKVKSWKGGFGFIAPSEPIDHPLFTGNVFLHKADIVDTPETIEAGASVAFFLYADPQGLGAEECTIKTSSEKEDSKPTLKATPKMASPASPTRDGGPNLLMAKPKASAGSLPLGVMAPRAKAMLRATPKAGPGARPSNPDLAAKIAANPELAQRLSAWMMDSGG